MNRHQGADVLIVGAGICGLLAAAGFAANGRRVLVLDKGRSVGGRLATRRIGPGRADHGAQFMTTRDPAFGALVAQWEADGLIFPWSTRWSDGSSITTPGDGHPRYAVAGGMNQLAKRLAADLQRVGVELVTGTRVMAVQQDGNGWRAIAEAGQEYHAGIAVLTSPVPQSLALIDAGGVRLTPGERTALEAIRYAPCLCGLFWVDGEVNLPEPGALQRQDGIVRWMADNRRKGISPEAVVVTVHANPDWSTEHYDEQDGAILLALAAELRPWLGAGATLAHGEVKRWRYALPTVIHQNRFLQGGGSSAPLLRRRRLRRPACRRRCALRAYDRECRRIGRASSLSQEGQGRSRRTRAATAPKTNTRTKQSGLTDYYPASFRACSIIWSAPRALRTSRSRPRSLRASCPPARRTCGCPPPAGAG